MKTHENEIVVQVNNLSKRYKVYAKPADMFWELVWRKPRYREFWALKDVSFEIKRGEVLGVIGRNGAGKTTLLRIISNTLDKTDGETKVRGKVSAIMALGVGFNLENSGRENILMDGLCHGMPHDEIKRKMDSIIDFSGLADFIDQPCKTYSSGMLARLAFSVAVSVEPDILIIDEALATGDMAFAAKSYARMKKIASSGATVIFVTHTLQAVYDLCSRAILLEKGRIAAMGTPRQVGYAYEQLINAEMSDSYAEDAPVLSIEKAPAKSENISAKVLGVTLLDEKGTAVRQLEQDQTYTIRVRVSFSRDFRSASIGYRLENPGGTPIYGTSTSVQGVEVSAKAGEVVEIDFDFVCTLSGGSYILCGGVAENLGQASEHYYSSMVHFFAEATLFEVIGKNVFAGFVDLKSKVKAVSNQTKETELSPAASQQSIVSGSSN